MTPDGKFRNPIIPGFNPDPSIVRVGSDYFLVTSTFEYYPGVPIYHSTDLLQWKLIVEVSGLQRYGTTIRDEGSMYLLALLTDSGRKNGYVWQGFLASVASFDQPSQDITIPRGFCVWTEDIFSNGSWSDPVFFDVPGIDQDLFFDDDGKTYLSAVNMVREPGVTNGNGLCLATHTCEIDIDTGNSLSDSKWQRISTAPNGVAEGPHIFKLGDYWYLSTAEGGTDEGHQQWISRSKEGPLGPWETGSEGTVNPLIFNDGHHSIRNTGHMDIVDDTEGNCLGRETFLAPMKWSDDGWPVVNDRKPIEIICDGPGKFLQDPDSHWCDEFAESEMALSWYNLRTPLKPCYSLTQHPGLLTLHGNAYHIADFECPAMLLQKQKQHSVDWRTQLEFAPTKPSHEAGTTIWWSQYAYASIGIRKSHTGDEGWEVHCAAYDAEQDEFLHKSSPLTSALPPKVDLIIHAKPTEYRLAFSTSLDDREIELGTISTKSLTMRKSGKESPNTGAHFGLYAHGAFGFPCRDPAKFAFAQWTSV
ncbi:hypothetical protein MBLNU13_g01676t1 [Cladosporium sp. NU13]